MCYQHVSQHCLTLTVLQVNDNWAYGNFEEAESNATKAKIWNAVTTLVGILATAVYVALIVFRVLAIQQAS